MSLLARTMVKKRQRMRLKDRREIMKARQEARRYALERNKAMRESARLMKIAEEKERARQAKLEALKAKERLKYLQSKESRAARETSVKAAKTLVKGGVSLGKVLGKGFVKMQRWSKQRWYNQ